MRADQSLQYAAARNHRSQPAALLLRALKLAASNLRTAKFETRIAEMVTEVPNYNVVYMKEHPGAKSVPLPDSAWKRRRDSLPRHFRHASKRFPKSIRRRPEGILQRHEVRHQTPRLPNSNRRHGPRAGPSHGNRIEILRSEGAPCLRTLQTWDHCAFLSVESHLGEVGDLGAPSKLRVGG
jgi:hypothetical protein